MTERIYDMSLVFLGETLSEDEGAILSLLCEASLAQWTGKLLPQYSQEDCEGILSIAASFSALANFLAGRETRVGYESYSAGDVDMDLGEKREKTIQLLRRQAEMVMYGYVTDPSFHFRGVRS